MLSENNSLSNKKDTSELEPETTSQNSQDQKLNLLKEQIPEEIKKEEQNLEQPSDTPPIINGQPNDEEQKIEEAPKEEPKIEVQTKIEEQPKIEEPKIEEQKLEENKQEIQIPKIDENLNKEEPPKENDNKLLEENKNININNVEQPKKEENLELKTDVVKPMIEDPSTNMTLESQQPMAVEEDKFFQNKKNPQYKNNLSGIPDRDYIIKKITENKDDTVGLDCSLFEFSTVDDDRNSGYRALSLQIFGNEDNHNEIRKAIYTCVLNNKNKIMKYNFQKHRTILSGEDYIKIIKTHDELIGDFEVKTFSFLFNAEILVFELKADNKLYLISEHPKLDEIDKNKLILNLCLIRGYQWQVLYEKGRTKNFFCDKDDLVKTIEKNIKRQDYFELKFDYCRDNRKMKYFHLENFLASKFIQPGGVYPDFINEITDERKKSYKKREFRELSKKYFLDDKTGRLKIIFNVSNRAKNKNYKEFYIPYLIEKFNIIREVHDELTHDERNQKTLDALVKEHDFWWYGIYQDIKNYAPHCPLCN